MAIWGKCSRTGASVGVAQGGHLGLEPRTDFRKELPHRRDR